MGEVTDAVGHSVPAAEHQPWAGGVVAARAMRQEAIPLEDARVARRRSRISGSCRPKSASCSFCRTSPRQARRIAGVRLKDGRDLLARGVVVTTGTFLNGLAHVGEQKYTCGRNGEAPSNLLGDQLRTLGLDGRG